MFWKSCITNHFENNFGKFVKLAGIEEQSKLMYWVYLKEGDYSLLLSGHSLDQALVGYSSDVLTFLEFGTAPVYIDPLSNNKIPCYWAYVTNAVANSIVFYAMMYLNNSGLSPSQIKGLRDKYSLGNLDQNKFTSEELRESFLSQSAFFLNLYSFMNENDRFENFADNLQQQERFGEIFRNYKNADDLKNQYHRKIFHINFECVSMRNNYDEEQFHQNTGVFTEKKNGFKKAQYYLIEKRYLEMLKMRVCKNCKV
ncbi:hypothetical protein U0R10_00365 [Aquirufa sp. OSTEICH-129V]|uniref:Uncharacterized protein n=1 Tax=Aquirufa avitistagni TaxID=3104728 RepID=A0ABW6D8I0_9BACT